MSNRRHHSESRRGWGLFSTQRSTAANNRGTQARRAGGRERARFLRMETLESRELLAAIAKFDFDLNTPDSGPAGWTHYYKDINPNNHVIDAASQIGLKLLSGSPSGFSATYATST